jgi:hypothetical protein
VQTEWVRRPPAVPTEDLSVMLPASVRGDLGHFPRGATHAARRSSGPVPDPQHLAAMCPSAQERADESA